MTDITPVDPTNKVIEEAAQAAREFLGKLVNPAIEEGGGILGDTVKFWRFKNKINLVLKAKAFLELKGIEPTRVLPKTLFPIIENGSLEDDIGMQERWAAMLAHAADPNQIVKIRPSYPEILKELLPIEVKLLDEFYEGIKNKSPEERERTGLRKKLLLPILSLSSDEYDIIVENLYRLNLCQPPSSSGGVKIGEFPIALRTTDFITLTKLGIDFIRACKY